MHPKLYASLLLVSLSLCSATANGQLAKSGSAEKIYLRSGLFDNNRSYYVAGTFWLGSLGNNPIVVVNEGVTRKKKADLGALEKDGYVKYTSATDFSRAIKVNGVDPYLPVKELVDFDHQGDRNVVLLSPYDGRSRVATIRKGCEWNVNIDSVGVFRAWQPLDDSIGLEFSSRKQALELLDTEPSKLNPRSKMDNVRAKSQWISIQGDEVDKKKIQCWFIREGNPGKGRILAWWEQDKLSMMWLPDKASSEANVSAFQPSENSGEAVTEFKLEKDDEFDRLLDRAFSPEGTSTNKFGSLPVRMTRRMDRETGEEFVKIRKEFTPINRYQAAWFEAGAGPDAKSDYVWGQLEPPGMKEVVIEFIGSSPKPDQALTIENGLWWPKNVAAPKHFGDGLQHRRKLGNGNVVYSSPGEVTTSQWIQGIGWTGEVDDLKTPSERTYFLSEPPTAEMPDNQTKGKGLKAIEKITPIVVTPAQLNAWNRMTRTWDACLNKTDDLLSGSSWGRFEAVYARSLMNASFVDDPQKRYLGANYLRSLQVGSFADYFLSRMIARMDFEQAGLTKPLNGKTDAVSTTAKGVLFQFVKSQANRYFVTHEEAQAQWRIKHYANMRNLLVEQFQQTAPEGTRRNASLEDLQKLVLPSSEPIVFVPAWPGYLKPAESNGGTQSENPFAKLSHQINVRYFDGTAIPGLRVNFRLPKVAEVLPSRSTTNVHSIPNRNWPSSSGASDGYPGSPHVSEWAWKTEDDGSTGFYAVGLNRWSDLHCLHDSLRKGIRISSAAKNSPTKFVSPVISMRWVVEVEVVPPHPPREVNNKRVSDSSVVTRLSVAPNLHTASTTAVAQDSGQPKDEEELNVDLDRFLADLFAEGTKLPPTDVREIPSADDIRKSISKHYGPSPYWKLQYLRYLVFSRHWGPRLAVNDGKESDDNPVVPHDDLTDWEILQELRILFPDTTKPGEATVSVLSNSAN